MKRVAFLMFVLALLAPQVLGASYEPKGPKEKTDKEKSKKIPVPEPAKITSSPRGLVRLPPESSGRTDSVSCGSACC